MMNYIISECYRVVHTKTFYIVMAVLSGLVLLMNTVNSISGHLIPDFRYDTFRFSLNSFTSFIMLMLAMGAVVSSLLFIDDRKNGALEQAVSYGISREKIFIGKCITAFGFSLVILLEVLIVYVGSAFILLRNPEWQPLKEMLLGIAAALPSAAGSLIFTLTLGSLYKKETPIILWWSVVFCIIPMVLALIGLQVEAVAEIASWMPYNYFNREVRVTYSDYQCLWDTAAGMAKCLISGGIGMGVFTVFGWWKLRRQEF